MAGQVARLAKGVLIYGVGQGLNRFLNLLLLPLLTAYLTPSDYGVLSLLAAISFVATPIFSLGLGAATGVYYFEERSQEHKAATIWTTFLLLVASTLFLATFGIIFSGILSQVIFNTPSYHYVILLSLISISFNILVSPFYQYLQFEERAKIFVALTVISTFLSLSLSVVLVVIFNRGMQGMVEGEMLGRVMSFGLFLLPVASALHFRVNQALGLKLLQLGLPFIPSFAFLFILQQGNKYFLQWYSSLDAVGIYTIGLNLGSAMGIAVSGLQSAWMPYFLSFSDKKAEACFLFGRIMTYYVVGFGALSLLFFIWARPVVVFLTQPSFHEAYKVVGLSAGAQLLNGVFLLLLPGIYFAKEVKYVSFIQAAAAFAALVLNALLIPRFGLLGAALTLFFGYVATAGLMYAWNRYRKDRYIEVRYEWRRLVGFCLVYFTIASVMLWQRNDSFTTAMTVSLLATCVLPFILYAFLNKVEKEQIWTAFAHAKSFCFS